MGYLLRVRLSSFLAGAAAVTGLGFYFLYKDYRLAQEAMSQEVKSAYESLDARVTALENLEKLEAAPQLDVSE